MTHSHVTAPTEFVDAAGVRNAYRRFGAWKPCPYRKPFAHERVGVLKLAPCPESGYEN